MPILPVAIIVTFAYACIEIATVLDSFAKVSNLK